MSLFKKKDKAKDKDSSKIDSKGSKPKKIKIHNIWDACRYGNSEALEKLLKKKSGPAQVNLPNEEGRYPIHIAAGEGHVAIAQKLMDHGAQCNMIENTESRWNVLQWAVSSHNFQMMKLIASQPGLKPDFRGPSLGTSHMDRNSALHQFARMFEEDPEDIIAIIVQRGCNVNIVNSHGETPLHVACTYKHTVIARSLIAHGANVNAQNDHGETPLHLGARYGPEAMVKLLLQGGGNPTIVGAHGTPLEVATSVAIRKLLTPPPTSLSAVASSSSSASTSVPGSSAEMSSNMPLTRALSKKYFWLIEYHEISLGKKIGEGGFGTVYRGSWRGIDVGVKFLKNHSELNEEDLTIFLHEISLMARLRHQNILLFVGACLTIPDICFLTEFISHGNMRAVLDKERVAPLKKVNMAIEAARGLTYLHSQNPPVLHRDLKTSNVLVDDNYHIKLADFGLSLHQHHQPHHIHSPHSHGSESLPYDLKIKRQASASHTPNTSTHTSTPSHSGGSASSAPTAEANPSNPQSMEAGKACVEDKGEPEEATSSKKRKSKPIQNLSLSDPSSSLAGAFITETSSNGTRLARALQGFPALLEQGGTLYTMAPEVLNTGEYTQESDIYALGIVFWELASEKVPFEGLNQIQMVRAIVEDKVPFVGELGEIFGKLVSDMVAADPKDRPTLTEIAERLKLARAQLGELR